MHPKPFEEALDEARGLFMASPATFKDMYDPAGIFGEIHPKMIEEIVFHYLEAIKPIVSVCKKREPIPAGRKYLAKEFSDECFKNPRAISRFIENAGNSDNNI